MKRPYFILMLIVCAFLYLTINDTRAMVGQVIAKLPRESPRIYINYIIAEVKDSKKVCKSEVMWCYISNETLKCDIDEKKLPSDVTHLKVCTIK